MCGLFGFTIYNDTKKDYSALINALAVEASERGTHATGISYNRNGEMAIYKRPLPAYKMKFKHFDGVRAVMGHTRHATQGDTKNNYNNHPFSGDCGKTRFTMAHNGIIYNDIDLRHDEKLPATKIKTDSYIYAQLLEKQKTLDFNAIKTATEKLQGYYTFSMLDDKNNLYIVKGDSPISIIHMTQLKMYIYASTDAILYRAIIESGLLNEIIQGNFETITASDGDILKIASNGEITRGTYTPFVYYKASPRKWYDYGIFDDDNDSNDYYSDLIQTARYMGYDDSEIDALLSDGYDLDDIAEMIYEGAI